MTGLDVMTAPWAIMPEKLREIQAIYTTHLRGEKVDIKAIEAKLNKPLDNEPQGYEVINGIAVFEISGIIAKRMNLFTRISGGVSSEILGKDIQEALADDAVNSLLFRVDSPGGAVSGTQELSQLIYNARGQKPMIAFTDGMMASAAYWVGAATDKIFISGDTTQIGSIGVVATHIDISEMEKKYGEKTTEITAGKYKRIASSYKPLTKDGFQSIKDQVDVIYEAFLDDVILFRDIKMPVKPTERSNQAEVDAYRQAIESFADGKVFIGERAINTGLVDGVSTMDQLLHKMAGGVPVNSLNSMDGVSMKTEIKPAIALKQTQTNREEKKVMRKLTLEEQAIQDWKQSSDLRNEFQGDFNSYVAYLKAEAAGKVKIIGGTVVK